MLGFPQAPEGLTGFSLQGIDFVNRARFLGIAPSLSDGVRFMDAAGDKFFSETADGVWP